MLSRCTPVYRNLSQDRHAATDLYAASAYGTLSCCHYRTVNGRAAQRRCGHILLVNERYTATASRS